MTYFDQDAARAGHPINDWSERVFSYLRQVRRRRGLKRLLDLDEAILEDIGVTRSEVEIAMSLPLSVDAATELRRMSLERRRRFM
ncbi:MAG: DUF1127 domain-containing protein [Silicimonas sp.]|jgi:uncharacterized protein YjiS (DUF1127 family)|nr:DUF1127 domain-containing protein [Silicimonas sp.]